MVRLGPPPKRPDRPRPARPDRRRVPQERPAGGPPALAEYLVGQSILSPFQAERILQGKTQGLVLGPYVLLDAIGSGSMGQVYKAMSKTDNQCVRGQGAAPAEHVERPAGPPAGPVVRQFNHPAVVPFVDVGTSGGLHYLVWPLVEGETLEARVQREGKLPAEAARRRS